MEKISRCTTFHAIFANKYYQNSTNLSHILQKKTLLYWKINNKFNKERLKTQERTQNSRKKFKTQGKNSGSGRHLPLTCPQVMLKKNA